MISTTCKDCQFKEMHGKVQTGCSLDIVDLFRDAGTEISTHLDEDRVYFKINGMCMYRRQEWPADKNIHEDVFIRSNIVILHDGEDLDQTLSDILVLNTPKPPRIVVCHTTKDLLSIYNKWSPIFGVDKFACVQIIDSLYEDSWYDDAFKKSKNGWVFFIKSGQRVDKDILNVLNHSVNHSMRKHIATSGIECYMSVAYKYLKGQRGSIKQALSEIGGSTVDWKDLDEDYRLYIKRNTAKN